MTQNATNIGYTITNVNFATINELYAKVS